MRIFIFFSILNFINTSLHGQSYFRVSFWVSDAATNKSISGAEVRINQMGNYPQETGLTGNVSFNDVPEGRIDFTVIKEGYIIYTGKQNISAEVKNNSIEIKLIKEEHISSPPPPVGEPVQEHFGFLYTTNYWHAKDHEYKPFRNKSSAITQRIVWVGSLTGIAFFTGRHFYLRNKANNYFNQGNIQKNHEYYNKTRQNIWGIVGGGALLFAAEINFSVQKRKYYKAQKNNNIQKRK